MSVFYATFSRDLRAAFAHPGQFLIVPVFFVLTIVLYPLALGPAPQILQIIAPGLLIVSALFAALLPLERLFMEDLQDGTLDILLSSLAPLSLYTGGKLAAHWLLTSVPLILVSPFMVLMLGASFELLYIIQILGVVTLLLTLIGGIGAALILGTRQGTILLALLIVPFYIPVLIFGAGALDLLQTGGDPKASLLFLFAMLVFALPLVPLACSAILRFQIKL